MRELFKIILLFILLGSCVVLLSACALFPPEPQAVVENARTNGCEVKAIDTTDSFTWRFLGLSSNRSTRVSCHPTKESP